MRTGAIVVSAALSLAGPPALAWSAVPQPEPSPTTTPAPAPTPAPAAPRAFTATRADLARGYIAFERLLKRAQDAGVMTTERTREVNLAFERATRAFFGGGLGGPASELDAAQWAMRSWLGEATPPDSALLGSLRLRMDEQSVDLAGFTDVSGVIGSLYDVADVGDAPTITVGWLVRGDFGSNGELTLPVVRSGGRAHVPPTPVTIERWTLEGEAVRDVVLTGPGGVNLTSVSVPVVREPSDARRARLLAWADELHAKRLDLAREIAVFRARAELVASTPNPNNAAQALADPIALHAQLVSEYALLQQGTSPYARRHADHWRTFDLAGASVPARVFVSEAALASPEGAAGAPGLPLVIALHGAGGDENMFFDGYGSGALVRLADRHAFIAVSPANTPFAANPLFLDSLVDEVARDFPVDRSRIYVVGHSLGSGVAAAWAGQRPSSHPRGLAAAACIAGFSTFRAGSTICPVLAVAGELDVLIPYKQIETGAAQAKAAGLPVEYRFSPNHGHTLVVGAELPGVVEWLLTHVRK